VGSAPPCRRCAEIASARQRHLRRQREGYCPQSAAGHQESFGSPADQRSFDAATDRRLFFATTTSATAAKRVPLGRSDRKRPRTVGEQSLRRPVELKLKAACTSVGGPEPAAGPGVSPRGPLEVSVGLVGPPFPAQTPDETLFRAELQRNQVVPQGYRDPQACVMYRLQALHLTRLAIPGPCQVTAQACQGCQKRQ